MKANEITTLDQLADFINSKEDFPLEAFDIIADKCGIDYVLTGFTAEFADVVVEVE